MFSVRCITFRPISLSVDGWYPATPGRTRVGKIFSIPAPTAGETVDSDRLQLRPGLRLCNPVFRYLSVPTSISSMERVSKNAPVRSTYLSSNYSRETTLIDLDHQFTAELAVRFQSDRPGTGAEARSAVSVSCRDEGGELRAGDQGWCGQACL